MLLYDLQSMQKGSRAMKRPLLTRNSLNCRITQIDTAGEESEEFNRNIVGKIEVIAEFHS